MMDVFSRQHMGTPRRRTEAELIAVCRWLVYETRCEEYDRTLPGGWSEREPDTWMVLPPYIPESGRFAAMLREQMRLARTDPARREIQGLTYTECRRWLDSMPEHIVKRAQPPEPAEYRPGPIESR